jgi:hypothetical protein
MQPEAMELAREEKRREEKTRARRRVNRESRRK